MDGIFFPGFALSSRLEKYSGRHYTLRVSCFPRKRHLRRLLPFLLLPTFLCAASLPLYAEETEAFDEGEDGTVKIVEPAQEEAKEQIEQEAETARGEDEWGAAAMPILAYTPEYGGMFGAAGLLYRLPSEEDEKEVNRSDPSTIVANAVWTTEDAVMAGIMGDASVLNDRIKVELAGDGVFVPTYYWGIGPNAYEKEGYTLRDYTFSARTGFKLLGSFYGGPLYEYALLHIIDTEEGGRLEKGEIRGSETPARVSGLGFRLFWDSTRGGLFPFDGVNARVSARLFREELASSYDFSLLTFDGRGYLNTFFSHVAAFQLLYQTSLGETPFQLLPSLGGEETMRGYYSKRFRDNVALSMRTEYRAPLNERVGLVGFFSLGQVGSSFGELSSEKLKAAGGGGFRITLHKGLRLNLRVDIAYSEEGVLPYINVREAF